MISDDELPKWEPIPTSDAHSCSTRFESLPQIRAYTEGTFNDVLAFFQGLDLDPLTTLEAGDEVMSRFSAFMHKVHLGDRGLEEYLARPTTQIGPAEQQTILALKLHRSIISVFGILFQLQPSLAELAWDHCEPHFREILTMSSQLLGADPRSPVPLFNSHPAPDKPQYGDGFDNTLSVPTTPPLSQ
jgi:hypothetical protein